MAVVFPAPLGPRKPKTSPGWTVSVRSWRATRGPDALRSPDVAIAGTGGPVPAIAPPCSADDGPAGGGRSPEAGRGLGSAEALRDIACLVGPEDAGHAPDVPVALPEQGVQPAGLVGEAEPVGAVDRGRPRPDLVGRDRDGQGGAPVTDGAELGHRLGRQAGQAEHDLAQLL